MAGNRTEGGGPTPFPKTSWGAILAARDRSSPQYVERVNRLAQLYWRPVYWYIRLEWKRPHDECKDLTQDFFLELLGKDVFREADPSRGRFRGFLRAVLRHFLLVTKRAKGRIKRGGGKSPLSLTVDASEEARVVADTKGLTPDQAFDKAWSRSILDEAYRRLEGEAGSKEQWEVFRRHYLASAPAMNKDIAKVLGITEFTVQNHLHAMRGKLKGIVREIVSDAAASPDDAERDLKELLLDRE